MSLEGVESKKSTDYIAEFAMRSGRFASEVNERIKLPQTQGGFSDEQLRKLGLALQASERGPQELMQFMVLYGLPITTIAQNMSMELQGSLVVEKLLLNLFIMAGYASFVKVPLQVMRIEKMKYSIQLELSRRTTARKHLENQNKGVAL